MREETFIKLAWSIGLSVERIKGGYTIDLPGRAHSIQSGILTDYGLANSEEPFIIGWLAGSYATMRDYE